jgi:hypothetical protein
MWSKGAWGGPRGRGADSGDLAGGLNRGSGSGGSRGWEETAWGLTHVGGTAGGRGRWAPTAAVARENTPANWRLGQINKRTGKLLGTLGKAGAARACGERRPGVEFTAVVLWRTAAARSPWRHARRRLGSIYKRPCLGEGVHDRTHVRQGQGMGTKGSTVRRGTAPAP